MVPVVSHPTGGRTRAALSAGLVTALVGSSLVLAPAAATAAPDSRVTTITFETTEFHYTILDGVVSVRATLTGGRGGDGATEENIDGFAFVGWGSSGRSLSGELDLQGGDQIDVWVGRDADGRSGGGGYTTGGDGGLPSANGTARGGGGGSSAIVHNGTPIVVAAGGGGGGGAFIGNDSELELYQSFGGNGGWADDIAGSGMAWTQFGRYTVEQRTDETVDSLGNGQDGASNNVVGGGGGGAGAPAIASERRTGGAVLYGAGGGGHGGNSLIPDGWQAEWASYAAGVTLELSRRAETLRTLSRLRRQSSSMGVPRFGLRRRRQGDPQKRSYSPIARTRPRSWRPTVCISLTASRLPCRRGRSSCWPAHCLRQRFRCQIR